MTDELLWLIMPVGSMHGWGVCGKYLALEISRLSGVNFVTDDFESQAKQDHYHYKLLSEINTPLEQITDLKNDQEVYALQRPVLQAIEGANLKPWLIQAKAPKKVGYTFFERSDALTEARAYLGQFLATEN